MNAATPNLAAAARFVTSASSSTLLERAAEIVTAERGPRPDTGPLYRQTGYRSSADGEYADQVLAYMARASAADAWDRRRSAVFNELRERGL